MPQFELEDVGPKNFSGLVRARIVEEAARRGGGIPDSVKVGVGEHADVQGWMEVIVDDKNAGRIRLHQRMRFRRD